MYYITNQTNQVIAADDSLLQALNLESIDELIKKILLEEISFTTLSQESMEIVTPADTLTYMIQKSSLSSMLGALNLIQLNAVPEEEEETLSILDDDLISIKDGLPEDESKEEEEETVHETRDENELFELTLPDETEEVITYNKKISLTQEEETLSVLDDDPISIKDNFIADESKEEDELFELTLPVIPEETIDEIVLANTADSIIAQENIEESTPTLDSTPIVIDLYEVSEMIGISTEDYNTFLNEYIDAAISLEQDLQSTDNEKRSSAITTLAQLADILQLPEVNTMVKQLSLESENNHTTSVEWFYNTLSRLTTIQSNEIQTTQDTEESSIEDEIVLNAPASDTIEEKNGFGTISLEGIKPIHFDFQLEAAANDLSLPVELIEEFVHDFIEQARIETKKMLLSYEEGDLDSIQKIGHLLKGASSNLRINALSDTLYDIQFCEDSNQLENFIKRYWAHFLSFEQQINIISK
ncbi:MAG: hypothetical protein COA92_04050 [Sulfurovum sp.]|nr:MAG: hypothetical protein COA92_04050 [Sulfurovum sp.]